MYLIMNKNKINNKKNNYKLIIVAIMLVVYMTFRALKTISNGKFIKE